MHYARIASKLYNTPLLLAPDVAGVIGDYVMTRIRGDVSGPDLLNSGADNQVAAMGARGIKPYNVDQGIAVINVSGELVNRGAWIGAQSGLTSYEGIAAQLAAASKDTAVNGILMVLDTPGGEAAGVADVSAAMRAAGKPVWSIGNTKMASSGYWIGATADRVAAVPDAVVGSIGVVWMHMDRSQEIAAKGVNVTVVQAGAKKTQFSALSALSVEARAKAETLVGELYAKFVDHVATSRGLSAEAVAATEADTYTAIDAKKLRLIDTIATVSDFHLSMVAAMRKGSAASGKSSASATPKSPKGNLAMSDYTQEQLDAAKADATTAGVKAGQEQERARISAILDSDEAKGRSKLAAQIAFKTSMSADDAKGLLTASAVETPAAPAAPDAAAAAASAAAALAAPANLLNAAMKQPENKTPEVGAGAAKPTEAELQSPEAKAAAVFERNKSLYGAPVVGIR